MDEYHGTTIIAARRNGSVAIGGDGQVTLGHTVMKSNACKIREFSNHQVLVGFAGATADAFTLLDRFEQKLNQCSGNLRRTSVELAKDWRTDRVLRKLEAMMIVAGIKETFIITGNGDVLSPEFEVCAIGSGGSYALAAARALSENSELSAEQLVKKALNIAADICIYTNHNLTIKTLPTSDTKITP